jgi:hypothetical protein
METIFGKFVLSYLLMPLIGVVAGVVMLFVAKKNKLLQNKAAIYYFLFVCVILALPALLGFIDYWFMPKAYIALSVVNLILGYFNIKILKTVVENFDEKPYCVEFLCTFLVTFVGAAFFSLIFNLCNELQYGLWASTCLLSFILPSLFLKTFHIYLDIPLEVYRIWSYDEETFEMSAEYFDANKIIVIELELFKQITDSNTLNIKVKATEDMPFGFWFKTLIDDYNKKSPLHPISYAEAGKCHGWIFYVNSSVLGRKKHIDPNLSFVKNKIKENNCIIAKRVQYQK